MDFGSEELIASFHHTWCDFYEYYQCSGKTHTFSCESVPCHQASLLLDVAEDYMTEIYQACDISDTESEKVRSAIWRVEQVCLMKIVLMYEQFKLTARQVLYEDKSTITDPSQSAETPQPHAVTLRSKTDFLPFETNDVSSQFFSSKNSSKEMIKGNKRESSSLTQPVEHEKITGAMGWKEKIPDLSRTTSKGSESMSETKYSGRNLNSTRNPLNKMVTSERILHIKSSYQHDSTVHSASQESKVSESVFKCQAEEVKKLKKQNTSCTSLYKGKTSRHSRHKTDGKKQIHDKTVAIDDQILDCNCISVQCEVQSHKSVLEENLEAETDAESVERLRNNPKRSEGKGKKSPKMFGSMVLSERTNGEADSCVPIICSLCTERFPESRCLQAHWKTSHKSEKTYHKRFLCEVCGIALSSPCKLKLHYRIHTGAKPHSCDMCDKKFRVLKALIAHIRIHTQERPHQCQFCPKAFSERKVLTLHERVHTGERLHVCEWCGKTCTNLTSLNTHKRIHTGDKPYHCEICGATFTQSGAMKTHKRIHTGSKPYTCEFCGRSFSSSSQLVTHRRTHTGEKPFQCQHCEYRAISSTRIKEHSVIHSDVKAFKCTEPHCTAAFKRRSHLTSHVQTHLDRKTHCNRDGVEFSTASSLKHHRNSYNSDSMESMQPLVVTSPVVSQDSVGQQPFVITLTEF